MLATLASFSFLPPQVPAFQQAVNAQSRVNDSKAEWFSPSLSVPRTYLLMGHMAFLCGVVVLLGLSLLIQNLCKELPGAGMAPGGPLGSSGIVTNEIHI